MCGAAGGFPGRARGWEGCLQVKPFVEVREGGKVISLGETRTRSKGIARLKELMLGMGELERLAILHTRAEADARANPERHKKSPALLSR